MGARLPIEPDALADVCLRHRIRRLSLFGSQLKGTARPDSDFDLANIEIELSALLGGRKVDLRTPAELSRYFREQVQRESEELYVAA